MIIFNWLAIGIMLISALIGYILSLPLYLFHASSDTISMVASGIAVIIATVVDASQWREGKKGGRVFFIPLYVWGLLIMAGALLFGIYKLLAIIYNFVVNNVVVSIVIAIFLILLFILIRAYTKKSTSYASPKRVTGVMWAGILLIIAFVGYNVFRYFNDRSNYNIAQTSYNSADCKAAIPYYSNVINAWRIMDIGEYYSKSQLDNAECLAFQPAVEKQNANDFSAAIVLYAEFSYQHKDTALSRFAKERVSSLFEQVKPSMLASQDSCNKVTKMVSEGLISESNVNLPLFDFACGEMYDKSGDLTNSFNTYQTFLQKYPNHQLESDVKAGLLNNSISCERYKGLQEIGAIKNSDFIPSLYWQCSQIYEKKSDKPSAIAMYIHLADEYPKDSHIAKVKTSLLTNTASCDRYPTLENTVLNNDVDFMSSLLYQCGQESEKNKNYPETIARYEKFLLKYPNHTLASKVEEALAKLLIAQAQSKGAGNIPTPNVSGSTSSGITEVVIQNDSPDKLRIVFSGPQAHIETIEACSTCIKYNVIGPLYCPEKGPIGRYSLPPGTYSVFVESIDSTGTTTPWTGSWNLVSGDEYYSCFVLITTMR